jgi:hypothetical protein
VGRRQVLEQTQHYNRFTNPKHQHYDPNWNDPNPMMDEWGFNCGVLCPGPPGAVKRP